VVGGKKRIVDEGERGERREEESVSPQ